MDYTIEKELELLTNKCTEIQQQILAKNAKFDQQIMQLSKTISQESEMLANIQKQQKEQMVIREQKKIEPIEKQVKYGGIFGFFQKQKNVVINQDEIEKYNAATNNIILEHQRMSAEFAEKLSNLEMELTAVQDEQQEHKNNLENWQFEKTKIIAMVKSLEEINLETE